VKKKRSFREKLADPKDLPRVQRLTGGMKRRYGPGTIVLPAPSEVEALMRKVPRGRVTTINQMRECLARRHECNGRLSDRDWYPRAHRGRCGRRE
jgi:hypothetical protein